MLTSRLSANFSLGLGASQTSSTQRSATRLCEARSRRRLSGQSLSQVCRCLGGAKDQQTYESSKAAPRPEPPVRKRSSVLRVAVAAALGGSPIKVGVSQAASEPQEDQKGRPGILETISLANLDKAVNVLLSGAALALLVGLNRSVGIIEGKLDSFATKEEVAKLATKEEVAKLATKEEVAKLATKEELKTEVAGLLTRDALIELEKNVAFLVGERSGRTIRELAAVPDVAAAAIRAAMAERAGPASPRDEE